MYEFKLPDLGEGIHEGQIVSLLVKEGDTVAEFQPMMEVETDKAAVAIPSPKSGRIAKFHAAVGEVVKVGQVLVSIDTGAADSPKKGPVATKPAAAEAPRSAPAGAMTPASPQAPVSNDGRSARPPLAPAATAVIDVPAVDGPVPAAPAVRKLAREMGVDIQRVTGTGPHGRILREDVERYSLGHRGVTVPASPSAFSPTSPPARGASQGAGFVAAGPEPAMPPVPAGAELPDFSQWGPIRRVPAPQIRKTIARQMMRAWQNVPRVTHQDVADITELEANRKRLNAALKPNQPKMTVTAIVLKAVASALREYPQFNCSFDAASGDIIYKDYIHIGVAVDTPRGLVVPVLRDVDKRSLPDIAAGLNDLANRTREGRFDIAELRGATFTVTNVGALGGTGSTPMVNFPEVAILALSRGTLQPAVRDGQIVPRLLMPVSLSFDHRIIDGADSARFTRDVVESLENPLRLISMA